MSWYVHADDMAETARCRHCGQVLEHWGGRWRHAEGGSTAMRRCSRCEARWSTIVPSERCPVCHAWPAQVDHIAEPAVE